MTDGSGLIGRDDVIELIRDLAERPVVGGRRHDPQRQRPVLVVEGAPGTGKSALLKDVARRLDQRAPFARIDFEAVPGAEIPQILAAVAFELGRHTPGYGSIAFPRLAVAELVMDRRLDLDAGNRRAATARLTGLLATERGLNTLRAGLARAVGTAVDVVQGRLNLPDELRQAARDVTDEASKGALAGLLAGRRTRRIALGPYVRWFGHRDRDRTHEPLDVLLDLHRWAGALDTDGNRERVDELIWDAFLTDLRGHFASKDAESWRFTAVLLTDNADNRVGRQFVAGLVQARGTRRNHPDPLTAVATSTGDLLTGAEESTVAEGGADREGAGSPPYLRHRLRDLSEDDVVDLIANAGLRSGNAPRLPVMIHGLTEGHPAATRLLITTMAEYESTRDQPAALLARPEPGTGPDRPTVAERIRADLVGDLPDDATDDLITCAAATDVEHVRALTGLLADAGRRARIEQLLWSPVGGAGPRVLRRLLLARLAERDPGHPAGWSAVFGALRASRVVAGDRPGELYYTLAAGDLRHVVIALQADLDTLNCEEWCERLLAVVTAPRRPAAGPASALSPDDRCRALLPDGDPAPGWPPRPLVRLVAGLWVAGDPLTDARRRGLHEQIADDFDWLAGTSRQPSVQGYRQIAQRHRRRADIWAWN